MSSAFGSMHAVRLQDARTARPASRAVWEPGQRRTAMAADRNRPDRVAERRRAVQLARHYRDAEDLSITEIARRLGKSPATVKGYFYDPTGEKAKAVKARYQGSCRQFGAPTQARAGKGDAYAYCKNCHPGAIQGRWTRELVLDAMRAWQERYGRAPSSYDPHARTRAAADPRESRAAGGRLADPSHGERPVRHVGAGPGARLAMSAPSPRAGIPRCVR